MSADSMVVLIKLENQTYLKDARNVRTSDGILRFIIDNVVYYFKWSLACLTNVTQGSILDTTKLEFIEACPIT